MMEFSGKKKGRAFRKQAEIYLRNLQELIIHPTTRVEQDHRETNCFANMAILSLLAAVLAYLDPEYKPNDIEQQSEPPIRSDN